jgi:hypothetical protein
VAALRQAVSGTMRKQSFQINNARDSQFIIHECASGNSDIEEFRAKVIVNNNLKLKLCGANLISFHILTP